MGVNIKDFAEMKHGFVPGHRSCAGCAFPIIVRTVLKACKNPIVVSNATGCLEVTSTIYPYSSWNVPYIHNTFENAAATLSGVEAAYKALKRKGKVKKNIKFIAFGGDGGTYDIGLQSLSGAMERMHNIVYVCYDNGAYMNTGNQRSSATPYGSATTTTPVGSVHKGKELFRKDLAKIMVAHKIPYVAQAAMHNWSDLYEKAKKAFETKGPAFINVLSTCTLNWKHATNMAVEVSKRATNSNFWPLYEVINGKYKLNYNPAKPIPVEEFFKLQGRFKHLLLPENKKILEKIQERVDIEWEKLLNRCKEKSLAKIFEERVKTY
jgi:pyruvate ferredoxin oxidoreductase beta subunit